MLKWILFIALEISGVYLLITVFQRLTEVWNSPLWNEVIMEPISGIIVIIGGFAFASVFNKRAR